jgi:predicted phage-related endonuclease
MTEIENRLWLVERKKGIGGSEIATILGLDVKYSTPLDVFLSKTDPDYNPVYSDEQLDNMERGHWYEVPLLEWYANLSNMIIHHNEINFEHPTNPVFRCTPDGFGVDGDEHILFEVKSTVFFTDDSSAEWTRLLEKWFIQGQWNLGVTGLNKLCILWIDGRHKRHYQYFDRNDTVIEFLQAKAQEFWDNHILTGIPPLPVNSEDVLKLYAKQTDGKVVEASLEGFDNFIQLQDAHALKTEYEAKEEALKEKLKLVMGDAEFLTYSGSIIATWKADSVGRFNSTSFKKDYPEIYPQYLGKPARKFLPKY